jgi:hypothetical protein
MIPIENAPEIVEAVWFQYDLPVIYRPKRGKILVKLPYRPHNKDWLKGEGKGKERPKWTPEGKYWTCPANGAKHGRGINDGRRWNVISETFAVSWGPEKLCCTLVLPGQATVLKDDDVEIVPSIDLPGLISRYAG